MHRQIHTPLSQRLFNLLGEHPLRARFGPHLRKGPFLQPVAGGLDNLDLHLMPLPTQQPGNMVRLP